MSHYSGNKSAGFTLVETMTVAGILLILTGIAISVWISSLNTLEAQEEFADLSAGLRMASSRILEELRQAAHEPVAIAVPPVEGLHLVGDSTAISFQKPLSLDGKQWTRPITFRLYNEDANDNLELDAGEDTNGNGVLDRTVERLEDVNGDGVIDASETVVIGQSIDDLQFVITGATVNVTLTARGKGARKQIEQEYVQEFSVAARN